MLAAAVVLVGIFAGVGISAAASRPSTASQTYTPPPADIGGPSQPDALFIGDSYSAGTGASSQVKRWTTLVSTAEGWKERNFARGGTGFVSTATAAGCGQAFCPAYIGMIEQAAKSGVDPDMVFIAGGQNDTDEWFQADDGKIVRDAINATYQKARSTFPNAKIIAVGPTWLGTSAGWQDDFDAAVQAAAAGVNAQYVSLRNPPVLNDPAMELGDGGHVNDLGHRAIADRVISALQTP